MYFWEIPTITFFPVVIISPSFKSVNFHRKVELNDVIKLVKSRKTEVASVKSCILHVKNLKRYYGIY